MVVRWPGRRLEKLNFRSSSAGLETGPSSSPSCLWLGHNVSGSTLFFLTKKGRFLQNPLGFLPENHLLRKESKRALKDTRAITKKNPLFSSFWQFSAYRNVGRTQLRNELPSGKSRKYCHVTWLGVHRPGSNNLLGFVTLGMLISFLGVGGKVGEGSC